MKVSWAHLGGFWGVLETSWQHLGPLVDVLEAIWVDFGSSWKGFEASWGHPKRSQARFGRVLEAERRPKNAKKKGSEFNAIFLA